MRKQEFLEHALFNAHTETFIHPSSYIGPQVQLGSNVKIGPFCSIVGNVTIGDNTRLYGHVMIGMPAEVLGLHDIHGSITIGNNCQIREFVSVNASRYPEGRTIIGNNCYVMNFCYVSHDATLEDHVTLINGTNLGGHTYLEHHVTMMANSATHQWCRIGAYSALAAYSATSQDIPPFCIMDGIRASFFGINRIGLQRNNFSQNEMNAIKQVCKLFFQDKKDIESIKQTCKNMDILSYSQVQQFISFVETSKRGVTRQTVADKKK